MAEEAADGLLRSAEERLGAAVLRAEPLTGGYTPQRVFRLRLDGGATCVLKAAPPPRVDGRRNWPTELEREIGLYSTRPGRLDRWRPAYLGDLSWDGWRGLLMEDLGADVGPRWSADLVRHAARELAEFHAGSLGLIHGDVRADNLALSPDGRLILLDWAEAGPGCPLEDVAYWAVGVALATSIPAASAVEQYSVYSEPIRPRQLRAAVNKLIALTVERLGRSDEPLAVRELRRRELGALLTWTTTDSTAGANENGS